MKKIILICSLLISLSSSVKAQFSPLNGCTGPLSDVIKETDLGEILAISAKLHDLLEREPTLDELVATWDAHNVGGVRGVGEEFPISVLRKKTRILREVFTLDQTSAILRRGIAGRSILGDRNPFEILGISLTNGVPTFNEVQKAYRMLAKQFHPDSPQGDNEKFLLVQAAYEALSPEEIASQYEVFTKRSQRSDYGSGQNSKSTGQRNANRGQKPSSSQHNGDDHRSQINFLYERLVDDGIQALHGDDFPRMVKVFITLTRLYNLGLDKNPSRLLEEFKRYPKKLCALRKKYPVLLDEMFKHLGDHYSEMKKFYDSLK